MLADNTVQTAKPCNIVIFGATGDLTKRKLIPALLRMFCCGLVHADSRILCIIRNRDENEWLQSLRQEVETYTDVQQVDDDKWQCFIERITVILGDLDEDSMYTRLAESLESIEGEKNAMFYCAIPPGWYERVTAGLGKAGLASETEGYRRLVIEKPFGSNLETARQLNCDLQQVFKEDQIYRIDHYLGKESVQNLLVFRFANSIMEPLWNRNYIDNIQVSTSETLGIEYRGKYYDKSGAMRDMIQSHLMQLMTLVAMEPPVEFTAAAVRDEKMKVLRAVQEINAGDVDSQTVSAQYAEGSINDAKVAAYLDEQYIAQDSTTETFAAIRFQIDNWRWQGVPFILWSGKRMKHKIAEVTIQFRKPPFNLFDNHANVPAANTLTFRLQPDAGITLGLNAKKPGLTTDNDELLMSAPYAEEGDYIADAYETLMHDVLTGDRTLFSSAEEVEMSWQIVEPVLEHWQNRNTIETYPAGSWDIPAMETLLNDCAGGWHKPE